MTRTRCILFLSIIVLSGLALRIWWLERHTLWQDEAETVINALQVVEQGYPGGEYHGRFLHENQPYLPTDHPMYEFASTNYFGSPFERNKGWLPYYLLAAVHPTWKNHIEYARFPFIAFGVGSIVLLYATGSMIKSRNFGLLVAGVHALNPLAAVYEHQVRYFAIAGFFALLFLFFVLRYTQRRSRRNAVGIALALVALFYTHIVYAVIGVLFLVLLWFGQRLRQERFTTIGDAALSGSLFLMCTVPWLIAVKFWTVTGIHSVTPYIFGQWFALVLSFTWLVSMCVWLFGTPFAARHRLTPSLPFSLVSLFVIVMVLFGPFFIPDESGGPRFYSVLLPLVALLGTAAAAWWYRTMHKRALGALLLVVGLVLLTQVVYKGFPMVGSTDWVLDVREYLTTNAIPTDVQIFVSDQHFVYWVYTPQWFSELVWPIRKSYFDTYPGRLMYIFHRKHYSCLWFTADPTRCTPEGYVFRDRIQQCAQSTIGNQLLVFDCPALPPSPDSS